MTGLAGVLAALAVLLCGAADARRRLRPVRVARPPGRGVRTSVWLAFGVVGAVVLGGLLDGARGAVVGWVIGAAGAVVVWTSVRAWAARRRSATRDEVARGCGELAALLRAGQEPPRALGMVARDAPLFAEAAAHHRVGGEVVEVLRRASGKPGAAGLGGLATAWQLATHTGAAMTTTLDDLAADLAAERELERTVSTELAATRLTARLLSLLPAVGLILGYAVGGDPLGFLIGSPLGLVSLAVGAGLAAAGAVWSELLADRAGRLP